MNKISLVLLVLAFSSVLAAQGGGGPGGGGPGGGPGGGGGATRGPATGGGQGRGGEGGGGDWQREAEAKIGWGEDGTEERILPGQVTEDKVKDEWLEKEAEKLGITDKKVKTSFKKLGKEAWTKSEAEDRRWSGEFKAVKDNKEKREAATKKHQERLEKIWTDIDEEMTKKEVLDEAKLATWKTDTAEMRKETATDKSARQDEIRERKIKELRERVAGHAGGGSAEKKEEKEKKGEEEK